MHTLEENKANRLGSRSSGAIFPKGKDDAGRPYEDLRWSRSRTRRRRRCSRSSPSTSSPSSATLGGDGSTYAQHMKDARFTIPTPALLAKVVDLLDDDPDGGPRHQGRPLRVHARQDRDRRAERPVPHAAPHHRLMVEMTAPTPNDVICDPACGTAASWSRPANICATPPGDLPRRAQLRRTSTTGMFHGFDFDNTMLRIGS